MAPLVSIIIPLYNCEKHIAKTIESAVKQTYKHIEIIIVNDGSTDDSLSVAMVAKRENVHVYDQPNKGASNARNFGVKVSRGEYIQFLDADDLLDENKIESQMKLLVNNPGNICYCPTSYFFDGDDHLKKDVTRDTFHIDHKLPTEFLINLYGGYTPRAGMIPVHSWLTPAEIIQKAGLWNEDLTVDDDGEYFCRVVLVSNGVLYADTALCYYRKYRKGNNLSDRRHENAMRSILKSAEFKGQHLLSKCDNVHAKNAIIRMFRKIEVTTYPYYKDLYMTASKGIEKLGGSDYVPTIGGTTIEMIKKMMGWKFARKLQFHLNNFKK